MIDNETETKYLAEQNTSRTSCTLFDLQRSNIDDLEFEQDYKDCLPAPSAKVQVKRQIPVLVKSSKNSIQRDKRHISPAIRPNFLGF